jgi:nucleotide-binding universal stress UspA family protein
MNKDLNNQTAQHILVPVSQSAQSLAALQCVIQKHSRREHELQPIIVHLLHVTPRFSLHVTKHLPKGTVGRYVMASSEKTLLPSIRLLEKAGISYEIHVRSCNNIPNAILLNARQLNCSKIVLGSRLSHPFSRFLRNSVTGRLLAASNVPVEVVLSGQPPRLPSWILPAGAGAAMLTLIAD